MKIETPDIKVINGDCRTVLKEYVGEVNLIVTSPPYADARKNHYDSMHPDKYAEWFLSFSDTFWNCLTEKGSLVINIKDKVVDGRRHRYVWDTIEKLCDRGWIPIDDYIWNKTNPMPGHWPNRLRDGWEYCFHLAKNKRPYWAETEVRKPIGEWVHNRLSKLSKNDEERSNSANKSGFGRNISQWVGKKTVLPSNVLTLPVVGKNAGHPAVFPIDLPLFFIKLLCPKGGLVVDPFGGSGTTGIAALSHGCKCILTDTNPTYTTLSEKRINEEAYTKAGQVKLFKPKKKPIRKNNKKIVKQNPSNLKEANPNQTHSLTI